MVEDRQQVAVELILPIVVRRGQRPGKLAGEHLQAEEQEEVPHWYHQSEGAEVLP